MQRMTNSGMFTTDRHERLLLNLNYWRDDIFDKYNKQGYVSRKEQRQLMAIEKTIQRLLKI